jgi:hypothetical protein
MPGEISNGCSTHLDTHFLDAHEDVHNQRDPEGNRDRRHRAREHEGQGRNPQHEAAHLHAMREAISGNRWHSVAISGNQLAISGNQWPSQHEAAHHVTRHGGRHRRREEALAAAHDQIQILQILLQLPVQMGG